MVSGQKPLPSGEVASSRAGEGEALESSSTAYFDESPGSITYALRPHRDDIARTSPGGRGFSHSALVAVYPNGSASLAGFASGGLAGGLAAGSPAGVEVSAPNGSPPALGLGVSVACERSGFLEAGAVGLLKTMWTSG